MSKFPCKECTERTVGCHSMCEKYIAAKEKLDAVTAIMRAELRVVEDIGEMTDASRRRNGHRKYDRKW